jgi:hypothetical protein
VTADAIAPGKPQPATSSWPLERGRATAPRIIVGITGATGSIIGVRLLEVMREAGIETHLIMSKWGARTMVHETSRTIEEVNALASHAPTIPTIRARPYRAARS